MKAVPYYRLSVADWDQVADQSSASWLFHRSDWVEIEAAFAARANCSFGIVDDRNQLIGILPLYRRDLDRGWNERVLDSGYHRHTGLALLDDLTASEGRAAMKVAMRHVFAEADRLEVDRILLNVQNLAPQAMESRTQEIPFWVEEYDFEIGLHVGPFGDMPVFGLATVFADQIVDLAATEAELFALLDSAAQRAIRKAQKHGLNLIEMTDPVAAYYQLAQVSARRTGEVLQSQEFYAAIWRNLGPSGRARILFAQDGQRLGGALFLLADKHAVSYLGGVFHDDYLPLRVSDFLHWQAMCWAKSQGCRYYRLGPTFPGLPSDWPVSKVSWFKGKFGSKSFTVIQGNYFRKPERYQADALREMNHVCQVRCEQAQQRQKEKRAPGRDPTRDLISVLRRYGYVGIEPNISAEGLLEKYGIWQSGSPIALAEALERAQVVIHPGADDLATTGLRIREESGPDFLYPACSWRLLIGPRRRAYRALLPHVSFSGPGLEPIWVNSSGRVIAAWWHCGGRRVLLVGLNVAEEQIRWTQGDPDMVTQVQERSRFNFSFERANYLYDGNIFPRARTVPWADRLGFALVGQLSEVSGLPLAEPLPGGARGAVLLTGDDDQAALACYREQLGHIGDFPISYFLLPHTKHTPATLAALPGNVELALHVDALERPDEYDRICFEQCRAVQELAGKAVRAIRNHGFLSRGYLGHLGAWEENGLVLDLNYAGLDGTALTGSFLPFRVRRPDGTWSSHHGLLTAFGDGMLYIQKLSEAQAIRQIETVASQVEAEHPGVLVFNMHPENIRDTKEIHSAILRLGRRPGWTAFGVETYLQWLEAWNALLVRKVGERLVLVSRRPIQNLVLRQPTPKGSRTVEVSADCQEFLVPDGRLSA